MRAKARLDRLDLYPRPVRIDRVRVLVWPWLFRLPWLRRFDGCAAWKTDPPALSGRRGGREVEARRAVELTR